MRAGVCCYLFGVFCCALVRAVNYSGFLGALVCVVTYSGHFLRAFCIINYSCFFWVCWSVQLFFGVFLRTPFVLFIIRVFLGALVCVVNYSGYFCAPFVLLLIRVFWGALVGVVTSSGYFLRAGLFCLSLYKDFQNGSTTKRASRSLLCRFMFFGGRFLIVFWTTFEG